MKKLIFLCAALVVALMASTTSATAQRYFEEPTDVDSLVNADEVIVNFDYQFKRPYTYSIQVQADSVSGATAGFCYLQFSNDKAGTRWVTAQTLTIDGTQTTELWEGQLYARRVRLRYTSSGTQKTRITTDASFKMTFK